MTDFVTLTCPTCSGKLHVTNDRDRFACAYCGNEHLVKRSGGVVSLAPVVQDIRAVREGVDRTASELAIACLEKEIARLDREKRDLAEARGVTRVGTPLLCVSLVLGLVGFGSLVAGSIAVGIGCLMLAAVAFAAAMKRMYSEADKHIADEKRLREAISKRQTELARHRHIVAQSEGGPSFTG